MGKVVKAVIGFVVAIGLVVAGVITGNPQLIIMGIGIGLSTLKSLKGPKVSPSTTDRLNVSIDPRTPRKGVFGKTAANTDLRDQEYTGSDKEYLHRFVVTASHEMTSYQEIWFDDKLAWTSADGPQGEYVGYLTVETVLEGNAGNAINISSRMGTTRRFTGCSYVHFRFKLTGNSKKAESPFSSSVPTRITIIGEGMPVYDPRFDSTVPGGSGAARADDQTTWQYDYSGSNSGRNPACQMLTYLLGWRIQNPVTSAWKLALGKGIPPERLDLESFITAANLCDEDVTLAVGGTEPRYRSDGVFSEFDQATDVLDNLKAAMSGELDDMDGLIRLTVLHNDLAVPVLEIADDDVLGEFSWQPFASLDENRNVIRGSFVDPSTQSLYQLIPYPDVSISSPDGIERAEPVNFAFVQSASQAQRLAKQRLQRAQYAGNFQAQFKARLWRAIKGDVVAFTFGPTGFVAKLFRIVDSDVDVTGVVSAVLREEHADIYLWDADERPAVVPVDSTPYTNLDLPYNQALLDLEALGIVGQLTNPGMTLPSTSAGVVTSYDGATGAFVVRQNDTDISDAFTLSTKSGGNTEALTVTYNNAVDPPTYTVTGADDDPGEFGDPDQDGAALTIRATGSGDFSGIVIDQVFNLTKARQGIRGNTVKLAFKRSLAAPATPTGNTPAGWSISAVPTGTDTVWATAGLFDANDDLIGVWSTPTATGGSGLTFRYGYNDTATYYLFNTVSYNAGFGAGTYVALQDNFSGHAPSGTAEANAYWGVVAAPGEAGTPADPPSGFTSTFDVPDGAAVSLRTIANGLGYTGASDATIVANVQSGTVVRGASGGGIGLDTGTWPTGSYTISVIINVLGGSVVDGGGGIGGSASGGAGGPGGDAIYCRLDCTVNVSSGGTVRAGGGGGGASNGALVTPPLQNPSIDDPYNGGGGGGGGRPNGAGGSGEAGYNGGTDGTNGTAGTTTTNGSGAAAGGTFGAAGGTSDGAGGAAGYAIRKNGFTVSVTNSGTITGTQG